MGIRKFFKILRHARKAEIVLQTLTHSGVEVITTDHASFYQSAVKYRDGSIFVVRLHARLEDAKRGHWYLVSNYGDARKTITGNNIFKLFKLAKEADKCIA